MCPVLATKNGSYTYPLKVPYAVPGQLYNEPPHNEPQKAPAYRLKDRLHWGHKSVPSFVFHYFLSYCLRFNVGYVRVAWDPPLNNRQIII